MSRLLYLFLAALLLFLSVAPVRAQQTAIPDTDYLLWSATRRLTAADFQMPLKPHVNLRGSSAAFGFGMHGSPYDLLSKRGNNIVVNRMLRTASWLDTNNPDQVAPQVLFQQTLFDIQEIYVRRFRQQARANAKKIVLIGKPDVNELMEEQLKACQQRQAEYAEATDYGSLLGTQAVWESQIQKELQELQAYKASTK